MKATAIETGNNRERIEVDGHTYIKDCEKGRWTHIVKVTWSEYREQVSPRKYRTIKLKSPATAILKSSSLAGAQKVTPGPGCIISEREIVAL